jgi:predicted nucleotidyltransferase
MSINLDESLIHQVQDILKAHIPDCEVWVFGSRAGPLAKPFSDLDLAIVSPDGLAVRRLALLSAAFEESDLPIKVDLVDWKSANPAFRDQIAESHEVIFRGTASVQPRAEGE